MNPKRVLRSASEFEISIASNGALAKTLSKLSCSLDNASPVAPVPTAMLSYASSTDIHAAYAAVPAAAIGAVMFLLREPPTSFVLLPKFSIFFAYSSICAEPLFNFPFTSSSPFL